MTDYSVSEKLVNVQAPIIETPKCQQMIRCAIVANLEAAEEARPVWAQSVAWAQTSFSQPGRMGVALTGVALMLSVGWVTHVRTVEDMAPSIADLTIQQSLQTVKALSLRDRQILSSSLGMDAVTLLKEAQKSDDMEIVKIQGESSAPQLPSMQLATVNTNISLTSLPETTIFQEDVHLVRFTDSKGRRILLGLDGDTLPMFVRSK